MNANIIDRGIRGFLEFPYAVYLYRDDYDHVGRLVGVYSTLWGARRGAKRAMEKQQQQQPRQLVEVLTSNT